MWFHSNQYWVIKRPLENQGGSVYSHVTRTMQNYLSTLLSILLVGGFNSFEKYSSNWIISPNRGENKKHLKPPTLVLYLKP